SPYIDPKSGVSARLSISALENLISTAERRMLKSGATHTSVRLSDFMGVIPAITGKVELVYEGEQEGSLFVAQELIDQAIESLFPKYFPEIKKLERPDQPNAYDEVVQWFFAGSGLQLFDDTSNEEYQSELNQIEPLEALVEKYQPDYPKKDVNFLKEFALWGMVVFKKLSKRRVSEGYQFKDPYGSYISDL